MFKYLSCLQYETEMMRTVYLIVDYICILLLITKYNR